MTSTFLESGVVDPYELNAPSARPHLRPVNDVKIHLHEEQGGTTPKGEAHNRYRLKYEHASWRKIEVSSVLAQCAITASK